MASSEMSDLASRTAVVCSDAGASNIIFSLLKHNDPLDIEFCLEGPAIDLWKSNDFGDVLNENLDDTIKSCETLISGSGWSSYIEHDARKLAKKYGVHSIAILDHWVNYKERFIRENENILPDEIWVVDRYALSIARDCFPLIEIKLITNHYLNTQLNKINSVNENKKPELLYVMEPARNNWGRGIPGEYQAFKFFIKNLKSLGLPNDINIIIRPHPSDPDGKYENLIDQIAELSIKIDTDKELYQSIGSAHWVAGCETYALIIALESGKKVFCSLPPWSPECRLPHGDLIHVKDIAS